MLKVKIEIKSVNETLTGPLEIDRINKTKAMNIKKIELNKIRLESDEYLILFNCVLNI